MSTKDKKIVHVQLIDGNKDATLWARCFQFVGHWLSTEYDESEPMYPQYKTYITPLLNGIDEAECLSLQNEFFEGLGLDEGSKPVVTRLLLVLFTVCLSVHDFLIEDFDAGI